MHNMHTKQSEKLQQSVSGIFAYSYKISEKTRANECVKRPPFYAIFDYFIIAKFSQNSRRLPPPKAGRLHVGLGCIILLFNVHDIFSSLKTIRNFSKETR